MDGAPGDGDLVVRGAVTQTYGLKPALLGWLVRPEPKGSGYLIIGGFVLAGMCERERSP